MIVDTSAIIAILKKEDDAATFLDALSEHPCRMSAGTYLECGAVVETRFEAGARPDLDALLRSADVSIVPFTEEHARIARQAYRDFGKGTGHPAQLNFGDCFSYALAAFSGEPLLWKGDDFAQTGLPSALDLPSPDVAEDEQE